MSDALNKKKLSRNGHAIKQKSNYTTTYLKAPLSFSLSSQQSSKRNNIGQSKISFSNIITHNIIKHNVSKKKFGIMFINNLIDSKNSHAVAVFKDYMIADFIDEFLRREYALKESKERIPKFANYYRNYLTFFCKPIFCNFYFNSLVQNFGEVKAEIYYNNNYGKKKKKKKTNINDKLRTIFSDTIKEDIDNNSIITQGNNGKHNKTKCVDENLEQSITLSTENSRLVFNDITKSSVESSLISVINGLTLNKEKNKQIKKFKKPNIKPLIENHTITNNVFNSRNYQSERIKSSYTGEQIILDKRKNEPKLSRDEINRELMDKINSPKNQKNVKITGIQSQSPLGSKKPIQNKTIQPNSSRDRPTDPFQKNKLKNSGSNAINQVNKYKLSVNPIHIKTISSNFHPSINAYNKIIKQAPLSPYTRTKKGQHKISFNSKSPQTNPSSSRNNDMVNMNLNNIIKLTLKLYQNKIPIHTRSHSGTHQHNPSPTINNFNININNHFCFNGNNSNSNSSAKSNEGKNKMKKNNKLNLQNIIELNKNITSRNKKPLLQTKTETNKQNGMMMTNNNFFMSFAGEGKKQKITAFSPKTMHHRKISTGLNIPEGGKLIFPIGKTERGYNKK